MATVNDESTATQPVVTRPLGTRYAEIFAALSADFDPGEVKTRPQRGVNFSYVTARTVANRLDDVLGPENWWDAYRVLSDHTILCELTVLLPDGRTVTKQDAGANATTMPDVGDGEKGGLSDAFKRAAAKWGVARYLYRDGIPHYGEVPNDQPSHQAMPSQARPPAPREQDNGRRPHAEGSTRKPYDGPERAPSNGRGLFAWAKSKGEQTGEDLIAVLNDWARRNKVAGKIVEWQGRDVAEAYSMAMQMLDSDPANDMGPGHGDAYEEGPAY